MNKNKVRTDNKKSQLYYELSFSALILCMFGINVANTQKVTNLYVVSAIMVIVFIIILLIHYYQKHIRICHLHMKELD